LKSRIPKDERWRWKSHCSAARMFPSSSGPGLRGLSNGHPTQVRILPGTIAAEALLHGFQRQPDIAVLILALFAGGPMEARSGCFRRKEHDDAIAHLQAECERLQNRIYAMYVDKLDGRIDRSFYVQTNNGASSRRN
jgi:hypothetical protein